MTLTIGQQGKLGNEVLTVVSFNEMTFKCDNGKSYMIKNATWMTEGAIVSAPKEKKATATSSSTRALFMKLLRKRISMGPPLLSLTASQTVCSYNLA